MEAISEKIRYSLSYRIRDTSGCTTFWRGRGTFDGGGTYCCVTQLSVAMPSRNDHLSGGENWSIGCQRKCSGNPLAKMTNLRMGFQFPMAIFRSNFGPSEEWEFRRLFGVSDTNEAI